LLSEKTFPALTSNLALVEQARSRFAEAGHILEIYFSRRLSPANSPPLHPIQPPVFSSDFLPPEGVHPAHDITSAFVNELPNLIPTASGRDFSDPLFEPRQRFSRPHHLATPSDLDSQKGPLFSRAAWIFLWLTTRFKLPSINRVRLFITRRATVALLTITRKSSAYRANCPVFMFKRACSSPQPFAHYSDLC